MITDKFLEEVAKVLNAESYVIPAYYSFSTSLVTPAVTDTVLDGEIGTRVAVTKSRSGQDVEYIGTRLATSVVATTGDTLSIIGMSNSLTVGTLLHEQTISGLIQTTAYDIEFTNTIGVNRS